MTLRGMLKHLASREDYWFTSVIVGRPIPEPWAAVDRRADPDWEWTSAGHDDGDGLRALWAERVERSRAVVRAELEQGADESLRTTHAAWDGQGHNGHADLFRESLDGETGE